MGLQNKCAIHLVASVTAYVKCQEADINVIVAVFGPLQGLGSWTTLVFTCPGCKWHLWEFELQSG